MAGRLKKYQEKRDTKLSKEPKAHIKKTADDQLHFVVQKHAARRLHYDLRLELDGVLVSFAVPKGPSMDPDVKRLAIHVEDHPLDYQYFAGVIPKGHYGAGRVEIWDHGTYIAQKKDMREGLKKGHLHFVLQGKKLRGAFLLIRINDDKQDAWLLKKIADEEKIPQKISMPKWIGPMLANVADKPFDDENWLFEIKWDGYRALAFIDDKRVSLLSRNQKSFNDLFPTIVAALKKLHLQVIIDGEVVMLDDDGVSRFRLLQEYGEDPHGDDPYYMIFDLLYVDGKDIRKEPLTTRKKMLHDLWQNVDDDHLRISDFLPTHGKELFRVAKTHGLEGLVAKEKNSTYQSARSRDWLKIRALDRDDFIIAGFTAPKGSRSFFGSLILGHMDKGVLTYAGHVGTGLSARGLQALYKKMKPLIKKSCPFDTVPKTNDLATWLEPKLIAEISFKERGKNGILRQGVFCGLREDKDIEDLKSEKLSPTSSKQKFTNQEKILWPQKKITKGDLLGYYEAISQTILPHLHDRPLMLRRFPNGIDAPSFYQKNLATGPSWLKTVNIKHRRGTIEKIDHYPVINDQESLLYIANLAAIELHPMLCRGDRLEFHDFVVIDLDPEDLPFKRVVDVALLAHELFNDLGMTSFCKTSGGRGLHIYIPTGGEMHQTQCIEFAELLARYIMNEMPKLISLERMPAKRQKKVYIDYLQNTPKKSMIAAYSLRAQPNATVSTPLQWDEVDGHLDPQDFTIATMPTRIKKFGDVFAQVLTESLDLNAVLNRLSKRIKK